MHQIITDFAPGNRCSIIQRRNRRACVFSGRAIQLTFEDAYIRVVLLEINLRLRFEVGTLEKNPVLRKVPPLLNSRLPAPTTVVQV